MPRKKKPSTPLPYQQTRADLDEDSYFEADAGHPAPDHAPLMDPNKHCPRADLIVKVIPEFTGKSENWPHWKSRVRSVFAIHNIATFLDVAENEDPSEWGMHLVANKPMLAYIFNILMLIVDSESEVLIRHSCSQDGMHAWRMLCERYQGVLDTRSIDLRMKLQSLRWRKEAGMSVHTYLANIQNLCVELGYLGESISEATQIGHVLRGLPRGPEYANFIAMERVQPRKRIHETRARLIEFAKQLEPYASVAQSSRATRPGNRTVHHTWTPSEEEVLAIQSSRECWVCGKPGHISRDCPVRLQARTAAHVATSSVQLQSDNSMLPEDADDAKEDDYLSCSVFEQTLAVKVRELDRSWIVDSGATSHMTNQKDWMSNIQEAHVPLGTADASSTALVATAKGDVKMQVRDHLGGVVTLVLRNVLYAQGLCANILSVGTLKGKGLQTDFSSNRIKSDKGRELPLEWVNRLPYLHAVGDVPNTVTVCNAGNKETCCAATVDGAMQLHRQYAHAGLSSLRKLHPTEIPPEVAKLDCASCHMGKSTQAPFPQSVEFRAVKPLQCVHSDIWGPYAEESINGAKYLISFVDDFSRFAVVFSMPSRSGMMKCIKKFTQQFGVPRTLHGDNEYQSKELKQYGQDVGMKIEKTSPYCPQQNGVAERLWGLLADKVRAMLHWSGVPQEFWSYAFIYSSRVRNMLPSRANTDMAPPQQLFFGESDHHGSLPVPPPVWGCLSYVHIQKEQQADKLDPRAVPAVFIGWSRVRKAGKYFIPARSVVVHSRSAKHMNHTPGWQASRKLTVDFVPDDPFENEDKDEAASEKGGANTDVSESEAEDDAADMLDNAETGARRSRRLSLKDRVNYEEPHVPRIPGFSLLTQETCDNELGRYEHLYKHKSELEMSYKDVMALPDGHLWKAAVLKELKELLDLKAFRVCQLPAGRKCVKHKWVFKRKRLANGQVERYKARIVGKGYTQIEGVDYHEVFASVIRPESFRMLLAVAMQKGLKVFQLDIGNAFLNAPLEEEVYVTLPEGYHLLVESGSVPPPEPASVWCLQACLPGLHQSGRNWQITKSNTLLQNKFIQSAHDPCVFFNATRDILIGVYVDDDVIVCRDESAYNDVVLFLRKHYRVTDLGLLNYFLGVEVQYIHEGIHLCQSQYIARLLERLQLTECNPAKLPMDPGVKADMVCQSQKLQDDTEYRSVVGALLYAARWTRPDIAFAVSFCGRFASAPTTTAWAAVKHILRYLKGTPNVGLQYSRWSGNIHGFSDSDFADDATDRKSVTGHVFFAGSCVLSWNSKKQEIIATSTTEAEYIALFSASQEAVFLGRMMAELLASETHPVRISTDSNGALALSKNPVAHKRTKHIDVKYHALRERVARGLISVDRVCTTDNVADVLTKPLPGPAFTKHILALIS